MLDRLKSALVLAETLNYHRAAERLGISQPHLTRSIKSLETELGIVLFMRGPHGVSLAPDADLVLKEASAFVLAEATFKRRTSLLRKSASETLRAAVGAFVSQSWLGSALTALKAAQPNITISVRELDWWTLADALRRGECEIAIGELSGVKDSDIACEPFPQRTGGFMVAAGHPLASMSDVRLEDIAAYPLAGPRLPSRIAEVLPKGSALGDLDADGRFFVPVIECATPRSMIDVVLASNAVCMLLPEYCREQIEANALRQLPFHPPWLKANQGIMYKRSQPLSGAALAFRSLAKHVEMRYFEKSGTVCVSARGN